MTAYTPIVRSLHDDDPLAIKRCLLQKSKITDMGLSTGDMICITPDGATEPVSLCVVWPSNEVGQSETSLSYNSFKALGLEPPSKVQLWNPPRANLCRATRIVIKEQHPRAPSGQRAEWLKLLAREILSP
ncbi:hypothetical protein FS749_016273 [Ceratobasidium sp. UAMH 11750]|nr:hypothetical protein FS749_016273 [Ceratobasidium sp. UAMH 11750]